MPARRNESAMRRERDALFPSIFHFQSSLLEMDLDSHSVDQPWEQLGLVMTVLSMSKGKALEADGKANIAASGHVLERKTREGSVLKPNPATQVQTKEEKKRKNRLSWTLSMYRAPDP